MPLNFEPVTLNYSDEIPLHQFFPATLRLEYQLADFADGPAAAREARDVVRGVACVGGRVGHGEGEAGAAHERDVDNVVADVGDLRGRDPGRGEPRVEDGELVERPLSDVADSQVRRTRLDEARGPARDDAGAQAGAVQHDEPVAVVRVEGV